MERPEDDSPAHHLVRCRCGNVGLCLREAPIGVDALELAPAHLSPDFGSRVGVADLMSAFHRVPELVQAENITSTDPSTYYWRCYECRNCHTQVYGCRVGVSGQIMMEGLLFNLSLVEDGNGLETSPLYSPVFQLILQIPPSQESLIRTDIDGLRAASGPEGERVYTRLRSEAQTWIDNNLACGRSTGDQEQALRLRALRDCDAIFTRICQENGIGIELISLARAAEALEGSVLVNELGAGHHEGGILRKKGKEAPESGKITKPSKIKIDLHESNNEHSGHSSARPKEEVKLAGATSDHDDQSDLEQSKPSPLAASAGWIQPPALKNGVFSSQHQKPWLPRPPTRSFGLTDIEDEFPEDFHDASFDLDDEDEEGDNDDDDEEWEDGTIRVQRRKRKRVATKEKKKRSHTSSPKNHSPNPPQPLHDDVRSCMECGATKTPHWRRGPTNDKGEPAFLCNACGLRYYKTIAKSLPQKKRKRSAAKKPRAADSDDSSTSDSPPPPPSGGRKRQTSPAGKKSRTTSEVVDSDSDHTSSRARGETTDAEVISSKDRRRSRSGMTREFDDVIGGHIDGDILVDGLSLTRQQRKELLARLAASP